MSVGAARATPIVAEESVGTAVEIDVDGRWDALALSDLLIAFHSFLVQRTAERWIVHAQAPGCNGEPLADALHAIEQWRSERSLDAPVRVGRHPNGSPR